MMDDPRSDLLVRFARSEPILTRSERDRILARLRDPKSERRLVAESRRFWQAVRRGEDEYVHPAIVRIREWMAQR